jgi:lambda repressor-like predicted transcriptional regulator
MRRLVLLVSAFVTVAVGGTAFAAQAVRDNPRAGAAAKPSVQRGLWKASTAYLELSPNELRARLRGGRSLAQIATAEGKSVEGLSYVLTAALLARVEAARSSGRLDDRRAQRLLEHAPALVERLVHRTPPANGRRVFARGSVLRVAGDYLGLTPKELVYELRNGTSLADLTRARGKSTAGLEAALLASFTAKVDAAVAAGRLDEARARRLLERAPSHIARLVNRSRG